MSTTAARAAPPALAGRVAIRRVLTSSPFLGAVTAILTWPVLTLVPTGNLEESWHAGLYLANQQGVHFGSDLAFTYGPLGFLDYPELYYTWPTRLSLLYVAQSANWRSAT